MNEYYSSGCIACGKPLVYSQENSALPCALCGKTFESNVVCENGHYVCDKCHAQKGVEAITEYAMSVSLKNAIEIATNMMRNPFVSMHGPEHHYLIVAALLAAYRNAGGAVDLNRALTIARQRTKNIPGGICGMWGSCGAGIGAGVFISVVSNASPLSEAEWGAANMATSRALAAIAENGGPRCCKRDVYISLMRTSAFVREQFTVEMEIPAAIVCGFFSNNPNCRKARCLFYPKKKCSEEG